MSLTLTFLLVLFFLASNSECRSKAWHDATHLHRSHRFLISSFFDVENQGGDVRQAVACWNATDNTLYLARQCPDNTLVASAKCRNAINQTGWAYLEVTSESRQASTLQAYAAGMVEAAVTLDLIEWHMHNTFYSDCITPSARLQPYCRRLHAFVQQNMHYLKTAIEDNPNDAYWKQVSYVLYQLGGLEDTVQLLQHEGSPQSLQPAINWSPLLLYMQLGGDLEDLEAALDKPKELRRRKTGYGHCSALIKVIDDGTDLLVAHDTWSAYQSMLRLLKMYTLPYENTPAKSVSFSSYPATLPSIDDFYTTSTGLVVTETTIGNSNAQLWSLVKPTTLMTWVRAIVANRLSTDARMWAQTFALHNSGTYNNQWMVIDYKELQPGVALSSASHVLWVLEQIPGRIVMSDQTPLLASRGYWPSYNVPFYEEIFNASGCWENVKKYGDWYTYDRTPRALMFKRNASQVTDMRSLTKLMRYNNYVHDPLSACNCTPPYSAENAIASRSDLNPANGTYPFASLGHRSHGSIDMKAVNRQLALQQRMLAISGPTSDQVPEFKWSTADFAPTTPHRGHPDAWHFGPVVVKWASATGNPYHHGLH